MDVIQKAQNTISQWQEVTKGDYDGHPFRGNAYVDEFYNPRPRIGVNLSEIKNKLKRKKKKEYDEDNEETDKKPDEDNKETSEDDIKNEDDVENKKKKEDISKARKKKAYDPDFQGNQWVDEDGNPRANAPLGGGYTRRERKKYRRDYENQLRHHAGLPPAKRRASKALKRTAEILQGSGLKLALDTEGKPVIVASNRRTGVGEWKRDKWGNRYLRYKPPEFMFHTGPVTSDQMRRNLRTMTSEARRAKRETSGKRMDDKMREEETKKSSDDVKKSAKQNICKAYRVIGKVKVYKGDRVGHEFYGNQWVDHTGQPRLRTYAGALGVIGGGAAAYRLANDKKIINRRRDLFATNFGGQEIKEIVNTGSSVPKSKLKEIANDIIDRRVKGHKAGKPLGPMQVMSPGAGGSILVEKIPRNKMEMRWQQIQNYKNVKYENRFLGNKVLAHSMDTELAYAKDRLKRIPSYLKRAANIFRRIK